MYKERVKKFKIGYEVCMYIMLETGSRATADKKTPLRMVYTEGR